MAKRLVPNCFALSHRRRSLRSAVLLAILAFGLGMTAGRVCAQNVVDVGHDGENVSAVASDAIIMKTPPPVPKTWYEDYIITYRDNANHRFIYKKDDPTKPLPPDDIITAAGGINLVYGPQYSGSLTLSVNTAVVPKGARPRTIPAIRTNGSFDRISVPGIVGTIEAAGVIKALTMIGGYAHRIKAAEIGTVRMSAHPNALRGELFHTEIESTGVSPVGRKFLVADVSLVGVVLTRFSAPYQPVSTSISTKRARAGYGEATRIRSAPAANPQAAMQLASSPGFYVQGRKICNNDGSEFIMRGINYPHTWYPDQLNFAIPAIADTNANCVRVVLSNGLNTGEWTKDSMADVQNLYNLVAILEVHDCLGYPGNLDAAPLSTATDYWIEIKDALIGQEAYVIINIANEPFDNSVPASTWASQHITAIQSMRSAGLNHALMIDAPYWGQDSPRQMRLYAPNVLNADPNKNIIFSVHMYTYYYIDSRVNQYLLDFVNANLPLVVGEFANDQGAGKPVAAQAILDRCKQYGTGFMGWSWKGNTPADLATLDIAQNWNGPPYTAWGELLINSSSGIKSWILPSVASFSINNGADPTENLYVQLNNICTGSPTEYLASESADFSGASWLPYSAAPVFTLSTGNGIKTVYFKTRNVLGESNTMIGSITLAAPAPPIVSSFAINNGADSTANRAVVLNNSCAGAPTQYMASESASFSGASWQTYSAAPSFTLSTGNGLKTVYFKTRNSGGESNTISDSITLMVPIAPTITYFAINNGAASTTNRTVTLNSVCSTDLAAPAEYMASESSKFTGAAWKPYNAAASFTLSSGNGTKTVYFKVRNTAGVSATAKDTISKR
ncbi:MAG: glycoside hydrolase family 5 protein [Candidatus Sumerlaeota bacterium]|nr:glycoside hydrolase family 5 protein [Candidatus Sumerlaeota bacterium]